MDYSVKFWNRVLKIKPGTIKLHNRMKDKKFSFYLLFSLYKKILKETFFLPVRLYYILKKFIKCLFEKQTNKNKETFFQNPTFYVRWVQAIVLPSCYALIQFCREQIKTKWHRRGENNKSFYCWCWFLAYSSAHWNDRHAMPS